LYSASYQPAPNPSVSRPPPIMSAVTAIFASNAGFRNEPHMTSCPSSIRDVAAASADTIVHASWMPSGSSSPEPDITWSQAHTESRPITSTFWTNARISGQVGIPLAPSDSDMGSITPILMRRQPNNDGATPRAIRFRDVRDDAVVPAPDLVSEQSRPAQPRQGDGALAHHTPLGFGVAPHRRHLDDVAVAAELDLQGGVVEVEGSAVFAPCDGRLIEAPVPAHAAHAAGAQGSQ